MARTRGSKKAEVVATSDKVYELYKQLTKVDDIARKLGRSRSGIIQLLRKRGAYESMYVRRKKFALEHLELSNGEIAEKIGVSPNTVGVYRREVRHDHKKGSTMQRAKEVQDKVSELLTLHGVKNTLMPYNRDVKHAIELEDGQRVAVYYQDKPFKGNGKHRLFRLRKEKWGDFCDLFILVAGSTDKLYIIPSDELSQVRYGIRISAIGENKRKRDGRSKYEQYLNRFDLLKQAGRANLISKAE